MTQLFLIYFRLRYLIISFSIFVKGMYFKWRKREQTTCHGGFWFHEIDMASRVDRFLNVRYSDLWQVRNDKAKRQLQKEHFFTLIWQYRGNKIVILHPTFPRLKFYWYSKRTLAKVSTETWNGLKPPDHVYDRWPRSTYRPTIDRHIGRQSTDISVDYRSAINRLSVDSQPIVNR